MAHIFRDVAAAMRDVGAHPAGESAAAHVGDRFELERPSAAWDWMRQTGQAPQGADWVRPQVADAWSRCVDDHCLPPGVDFAPRAADAPPRAFDLQRRGALEAFASGLPAMVYNLRPFLDEGNVTILLAEPEGRVAHLLDAGLRIGAGGHNLARIGADWRESAIGNNGVGTAALLKQPVAFEGKEHFAPGLHLLTTAGCPIFGPDGDVSAIIGMATERRDGARLLHGFLRITCELLEARLFERYAGEGYLLRMRGGESVDAPATQSSLVDGKMLVTAAGIIAGANRSALELIGAGDHAAALGKTLAAVVGAELRDIVAASASGEQIAARAGRRLRIEARRLDARPLEPASAPRRAQAAPAPEANWRDTVFEAALHKASNLQQHDVSLLITGESGVGKDHLVRHLHALGPRRDKPLVAINCAAIPRDLIESELFGYEGGSFTGARARGKTGKFVEANGGLLFLDEIGDMALDLQATLLRVLDSSEVTPIGASRRIRIDVRVVAATNRRLRDMVKEGAFRRDLYYRLNGVQIWLPPLRERPDRLQLLEHLLAAEQEGHGGAKVTLGDEVRALFLRHPWPGNIREARNVLRSSLAVARHRLLLIEDLPHDFVEEAESDAIAVAAPRLPRIVPTQGEAAPALADWEEQAVRAALAHTGGNIARAARDLGITRATLYHKMDRYGMRGDRRPPAGKAVR